MALVTVEDVLSLFGHDAEQDAFWVYCSDGAATVGTVQVAGNVLTLTHADATLPLPVITIDPFNLTLAANLTIGLLVAAINALPAGVWQAGIYCHSSSVSTDLLETGVLNALLIANQQTLIITGDYLITQLIARAGDFLDRYCGRNLEQTPYLHERYDGGEQKVFLKNWPIKEITEVCSGKLDVIKIKCTSATARNAFVEVSSTISALWIITGGVFLIVDGVASGAIKTFTANPLLPAMIAAINLESGTGWNASIVSSAYNNYPSDQLFRKLNRFALNQDIYLQMPDQPLDGYEVDYDSGILYLPSTFRSGWRNIFVTYTGGYLTAAIPPLLQQICIELVKNKYNLIGKDTSLKSEKIGRVYAYTVGDLNEALGSAGLSKGDIELFMDRV